MSLGFRVVDIGIVPTPTVQYMVKKLSAEGGVIITSSHNAEPWNGLKFVDRDSLFLSPQQCEQMFKLAEEGQFSFPAYTEVGHVETLDSAAQQHIEAILELPYIKPESIKELGLKVVLDAVNGAGGPIMLSLLQRLGVEVVGLNLEPTGLFAHPPEPVPAHLQQICDKVREEGADLGIALDPDADRCVFINESGQPLGEEYTLVMAVNFILGHCGKRGPVCKNLSSSRAVDDVAALYSCPVYATPVGEIHVAKMMEETHAVIGGEGNGGVMLPDVHIGRDSLVAAALALQHLAVFSQAQQSKQTISTLKGTLPQYHIVKLKAPIEGIDPEAVVRHFKAAWSDKALALDESDGLKIDIDYARLHQQENGEETPLLSDKRWVHLRKSNTEPIIRVIGEAGTEEDALATCSHFLEEIQKMALSSS
ncbi:Phosphoglucomutase/phosphomannomutase, C-terminal domain containing protein, variant 2 [Balamuthia mandrillaris]